MTDIEDTIILYVLMRTDLPDYQPGKCMAQANHAGTKFMYEEPEPPHGKDVDKWVAEGGGFGTCVVLGVEYADMRRTLIEANNAGYMNGLVHDPSYPIRDGDQMQHLPVDTCAYVFGRKSKLEGLLGGYRLFR